MKWREEKGIVLVITLLVMTILLMMGTAFLSISSTETLIAINERNRIQAYHLAEAGAEQAIAQLNNNPTYPGSGGEQPLGLGTYSVDVCPPNCAGPPPTPEQRIITARGCVRDCTMAGNAESQVEMVVQRTSLFPFGLLGLDLVELDTLATGTGVAVDSYDSTLGPYDPASPGAEGHIHSNGNVEIDFNNTVKGNVEAVNSVIPNPVDPSNTITGTTTEGVSSIEVDADISYPACGGYVTGVNPPAAYDGISCDLTVGNNETVELAPGTYAFNRVDVGSNGTLAITGPVTIYMTGQLKAHTGAVINTSTIPGNLMIFSSFDGIDGLGTEAVHMVQGSGEFYGGIHALNGEVEFAKGGWQIYGAIVAKHIDLEGGTQFHYDKGIGQATSPGGKFRPVAGTWREVIQ